MEKVNLAFERVYKARQKFSDAKLDYDAAIAAANFYEAMNQESVERAETAIKGGDLLAAECAIADCTYANERMAIAIGKAKDARERMKVANEEFSAAIPSEAEIAASFDVAFAKILKKVANK